MIVKKYIIKGKVQGVGFRKYVQHIAIQYNVIGYVKNLPTGEVEALALFDANNTTFFEARLKEGPPLAHVSDIQMSSIGSFNEKIQNFEIRF